MSDERIQLLLRELRERYGLDLVPRPGREMLVALRVLARCSSLDPEATRQIRDVIGDVGSGVDPWRKALRVWLQGIGLEDDWTENSYQLWDTESGMRFHPALPSCPAAPPAPSSPAQIGEDPPHSAHP